VIAKDAQAMYASEALGELRAAHEAGQAKEVLVTGTTIVCEPSLGPLWDRARRERRAAW